MSGAVSLAAPASVPPPPPPVLVSSILMDPPKVHEFMMNVGVRKAHFKLYKMILLGMMSGFFVMIGLHGMISMLSGEDNPSKPQTLLAGLVFSLGLIGIILSGGELFTGNCLLVVAVLSKRIYWWEMVADWVIIYLANSAGSIIFSVMLFGTGLYGWNYSDEQTPHGKALCALAHKKTIAPAYQLFFRGIFGSFCVCLAVLLAWSSNSASGRIAGIMWPIAVFVLSSFEHGIANQGLFSLATIVNCPVGHGWYWVNLAVTTPATVCGGFLIGVMYYFISIWGTDLSLPQHPTYAADGVTICACGTGSNNGEHHPRGGGGGGGIVVVGSSTAATTNSALVSKIDTAADYASFGGDSGGGGLDSGSWLAASSSCGVSTVPLQRITTVCGGRPGGSCPYADGNNGTSTRATNVTIIDSIIAGAAAAAAGGGSGRGGPSAAGGGGDVEMRCRCGDDYCDSCSQPNPNTSSPCCKGTGADHTCSGNDSNGKRNYYAGYNSHAPDDGCGDDRTVCDVVEGGGGANAGSVAAIAPPSTASVFVSIEETDVATTAHNNCYAQR